MKRYNNIVREFYRRTFLSVIIISIFCLYIIYSYKKAEFSNGLSVTISSSVNDLLSENGIRRLDINDIKLKNKLNKISRNIIYNLNFIHVTVFSTDREVLTSIDRDGYSGLYRELWITKTLEKLNFPDSHRLIYRLQNYDKNVFLQILYPVYSGDKLIGYLGGVSRVDKRIVKDFEDNLISTLLTVIFSVFALSIIIFPIIKTSYNKIEENRFELIKTNIHTLMTLGDAIALRDSDTNDHNYRVTFYSIRLAEEMGLKKYTVRSVIKGALLHDIGKIGISDTILLKDGPLNYEEYETMKDHVILGASLVADSPWLENGLDVIRYHHEKFDGTGYIRGLAGEDIPITARIFSIADVFDALTSKRPYKEPLGVIKTIKIMNQGSGLHFDPKILDVFIRNAEKMYNEAYNLSTDILREKIKSLTDKYFME